MLGFAISSLQFSGVTLPPYWMRIWHGSASVSYIKRNLRAAAHLLSFP